MRGTRRTTAGVAATQACLHDERCKAVINLGGFMFADGLEEPLNRPYMDIGHIEPWCLDCPAINNVVFYGSNADAYTVQLMGASHATPTDLLVVGECLPEKSREMLGGLEPRYHRIVGDYVRQFFGLYLKSEPAPLLEGPRKDYPEVRFHSRRP